MNRHQMRHCSFASLLTILVIASVLWGLSGCQSKPPSYEGTELDGARHANESNDDAATWETIKSTNHKALLVEFIHKYPYSALVSKARLRLKLIEDGDIQ